MNKNEGKSKDEKSRPCIIIHTRQDEYGEIEVYICPITHTQPENSDQSIEIPLATKQRHAPILIMAQNGTSYKIRKVSAKKLFSISTHSNSAGFPDTPSAHAG